MNKKGFTLVEILAAIVILSLIITVVATNGFGAFNSTKKRIEKEAIKEIQEAAKVFLTDIEYCDEDINDNIFSTLNIEDNDKDDFKCDDLQEKAKGDINTEGECIELSLENLKKLQYVTSNVVYDLLKSNPDYKIRACLNDGEKNIKLDI